MASSSLNENQNLVSSFPNNDLEGIVAADTFEGSSSEADGINCLNEAHSRKEIKKKKIAIPNPASSAVVVSKAAIPKRPREEKVDVNRSENRSVVVQVSSKRKKVKVAKSTTTDVNKSNSKSSSAGITWTDTEEMVILGGLISFNGENIQHKPEDFYMYIKDRLGKGDPIQVQKKVTSLKKKYRRMQEQAQNNPASLINSHEEMIFNLSKICWGEETKSETKNTRIANADADDNANADDDKINKEVQTPLEKRNVQIHMDKKNQDQKNEVPMYKGAETKSETKNTRIAKADGDGDDDKINKEVQTPLEKKNVQIHMIKKNKGLKNKGLMNKGLMNTGLMNTGLMNQHQKNEVPMNQHQKNEVPMNQIQKNEVPMNQNQKNEVPMNQNQKNEVPMNMVLMNEDQMNKIQRSEIFQVLRYGLHNYFRTEPFDPMWADAEEIDSLADDWKEFKIAEAKYKMAKSKFDMKAKGIAIKAYEEFGYPNDS